MMMTNQSMSISVNQLQYSCIFKKGNASSALRMGDDLTQLSSVNRTAIKGP